MKIYLGTQNKGKVAEFEQTWLKDKLAPLPQGLAEPVESGHTCEENAQIKARYYHQHLSRPVLSDDSGFFVPKLDGFPGVLSSRVIKDFGSIDAVFKEIETKAGSGVKAYFITVLCFINEKGEEFLFQGKLPGTLSFPATGENGFGYDPIFIPEGFKQALGELPVSTKLEISHRAKALERFYDFFKSSCEL